MIGMPSAFALGIFSGKFIFIFVLQKSLRAFLKNFFTVGSLWETASYTKEPLHTRFVQWLFIFHSVFTVRCTRCPSSRNCPRCTLHGCAGR